MASTLFMPGDDVDVAENEQSTEKPFFIGPGLKMVANSSKIRSNRCGILRKRQTDEQKTDAVWLEYRQKRYIPVMNDVVVGQIVQKTSEFYKVDFGSVDLANLSALNFEGASKRNKPNIKIGDLIYGRIVQTIEPELSCIGLDGISRCLGNLPQGGFLARHNSNVVKKLMSRDFPLLVELGKEIPFEICIGVNGWIWLKAHNVKETILLSKAIEMSEFLTNQQIRPLVIRWMDYLRGIS